MLHRPVISAVRNVMQRKLVTISTGQYFGLGWARFAQSDAGPRG